MYPMMDAITLLGMNRGFCFVFLKAPNPVDLTLEKLSRMPVRVLPEQGLYDQVQKVAVMLLLA